MRSRIRKGKVLRSHLDSVLGVGSPRALELSVLDEGPLAAAFGFLCRGLGNMRSTFIAESLIDADGALRVDKLGLD